MAEDKTEPKGEISGTPNFAEIGATGLNRWGGVIEEEWLSELKGVKKWKTIKEMRHNDPIVGAVLFAIDMLIRQVQWNIEAASEEDEDQERKEFVEQCMMDMNNSWESTISEILSFLPFGFSYHEIVYKRRMGPGDDPSKRSQFSDGKIGWRKLPIRAQDTLEEWVLDENGGIKGMIQNPAPDYQLKEIPIEKALLFRTTMHKNNPEGMSVLRNAFRPWFFKRRIEEIEGIGIERDLAGLPVMYVPARILSGNANATDAAILRECKKVVTNIRRDEQEGIVMPNERDNSGHRLYELELLSTGGTRQFDTNKIINRYDQRIAMTVLADFILLGHEKVGSFALSDNKTSLFAVAIKAWLDEIKGVFNQHAIPRLFKINGMSLENMPELTYGDIETPDLGKLAEYISKLSASGADLFPDDELENHLREIAGLPIRIQDDLEDDLDLDEDLSDGAEGDANVEGIPDVEGVKHLNGAQITALLNVVDKVKEGGLSEESAKAILTETLGISSESVDKILKG